MAGGQLTRVRPWGLPEVDGPEAGRWPLHVEPPVEPGVEPAAPRGAVVVEPAPELLEDGFAGVSTGVTVDVRVDSSLGAPRAATSTARRPNAAALVEAAIRRALVTGLRTGRRSLTGEPCAFVL